MSTKRVNPRAEVSPILPFPVSRPTLDRFYLTSACDAIMIPLSSRATPGSSPPSHLTVSAGSVTLFCIQEQDALDHNHVEPPTLFKPFNEPRLRARPCERLLIRTKPVTGPFSPSFSILRFAKASSPASC